MSDLAIMMTAIITATGMAMMMGIITMMVLIGAVQAGMADTGMALEAIGIVIMVIAAAADITAAAEVDIMAEAAAIIIKC